jgi:hypothetical protein
MGVLPNNATKWEESSQRRGSHSRMSHPKKENMRGVLSRIDKWGSPPFNTTKREKIRGVLSRITKWGSPPTILQNGRSPPKEEKHTLG